MRRNSTTRDHRTMKIRGKLSWNKRQPPEKQRSLAEIEAEVDREIAYRASPEYAAARDRGIQAAVSRDRKEAEQVIAGFYRSLGEATSIKEAASAVHDLHQWTGCSHDRRLNEISRRYEGGSNFVYQGCDYGLVMSREDLVRFFEYLEESGSLQDPITFSDIKELPDMWAIWKLDSAGYGRWADACESGNWLDILEDEDRP